MRSLAVSVGVGNVPFSNLMYDSLGLPFHKFSVQMVAATKPANIKPQ